MNKKIKLNDVKVEWLNKRALVLISIFATAAYKKERVVIDLRAKDVLEQVSSLVKTSGNSELVSIYQRIKREVKFSLRDIKLENALNIARDSVQDNEFEGSDTTTPEADSASSRKDSMFLDRAYPL